VEAVLKPGFLGRLIDRAWRRKNVFESGSREGSSLAPEKAPVWLRSQVNRKVETFFNGNVETFFNEKVETFFNGKVETFHWTRNGNVLNKLMHFPK